MGMKAFYLSIVRMSKVREFLILEKANIRLRFSRIPKIVRWSSECLADIAQLPSYAYPRVQIVWAKLWYQGREWPMKPEVINCDLDIPLPDECISEVKVKDRPTIHFLSTNIRDDLFHILFVMMIMLVLVLISTALKDRLA